MKITKSQLKQIIKEEADTVLSEEGELADQIAGSPLARELQELVDPVRKYIVSLLPDTLSQEPDAAVAIVAGLLTDN